MSGTVIGTLSLGTDNKTVTVSDMPYYAHTDDGTYYSYFGYALIGSNDGTNWTRVDDGHSHVMTSPDPDCTWHLDNTTGSFTKTYENTLDTYGYSQYRIAYSSRESNPSRDGWFFLSSSESRYDTVTSSVSVTNSVEVTASGLDMETSTFGCTTGLSVAAEVDDTPLINAAFDTVTNINVALELVPFLDVSPSFVASASLVIEAQEVLAVQYFISGNVMLSGTAQPNVKIFVIHEETETVGAIGYTDESGNYEIGVAETGTYHVFAIYSDDVGNKYTAMVQPFVAVS